MTATNSERQNPVFYVLIAILIFMSVAPVILLLMNSLRLDVHITSGAGGLHFMPKIGNCETALCDILWYEPDHLRFSTIRIGGVFTNPLIIALISTALTLIFGCMAAYALVLFRFMGRDTASLSTLAVRMIPPAVLLVPIFALWNNAFCRDND